jgi:TPR repeat protein
MRPVHLAALLLFAPLGACAPARYAISPADVVYPEGAPVEPERDPPTHAASCTFEDDAAVCQRLCTRGDAVSCNNLGAMVELGRLVARDEARALSLYRDACLAGADAACINRDRLLARAKREQPAEAAPPAEPPAAELPPPPLPAPPAKAAVNLTEARARCAAGEAASCDLLPGIHIHGNVEIHGNVKIFGDVYLHGK